MALSKRSIERLIDLAENKLSNICAFDRDDLKEISELESCIEELGAMHGTLGGAGTAARGETKRAAG